MSAFDNKDTQEILFMKFAYQFHETMKENQLSLAYQGDVTQQIMKAFTTLTETNMDKEDEDSGVKRKVFHVMVECLQNICKHSDDVSTGLPVIPGQGIFLVAKCENGYRVVTGNTISNDKRSAIEDMLKEINSLDKEGLKVLYKKQMREGSLSEKGGAGLGLIDMAKKTGQKIDYHFEVLNDKTSFFLLSIKVLRA